MDPEKVEQEGTFNMDAKLLESWKTLKIKNKENFIWNLLKSEWIPPKQRDLLYWKDPYKTGIVFGTGLILLLSLTWYSIISVVAHLSLIGLMMGMGFKIYRNLSYVTHFGEDPLENYFNMDVTTSSEQIHQHVDIMLGYGNEGWKSLRRLFLMENIMDSLKFGLILYCMTYIGSWINGMTLINMAYVSFFTVPKIYEIYQDQIDSSAEYLKIHINSFSNSVKYRISQEIKED
ncbi:reticulon-1-A-like [Centruroides sculpturatus]|uniref:reticulon-1-A-like n=1 Tax=Centruroides sculpturatus TaxID=218467 RepID=UPI000C6CCDD4|nr:reticulon-1-A-like [Centruroides sculpturatus]